MGDVHYCLLLPVITARERQRSNNTTHHGKSAGHGFYDDQRHQDSL
jgi:hypothetical protein